MRFPLLILLFTITPSLSWAQTRHESWIRTNFNHWINPKLGIGLELHHRRQSNFWADEKNIFDEATRIFNGKEIDFYIETEPRSNGSHWWLRVYSPDSESIREALGLSREPYFGLHLTIGHANERNIEHSEYILNQCKRFELISNDPRKPFNEHDIKEFND